VPHTFSKEPFIVLKKALCTLGNNPVFFESALQTHNTAVYSVEALVVGRMPRIF
jgi:hypothetical protein